jgi:hypothetical protein
MLCQVIQVRVYGCTCCSWFSVDINMNLVCFPCCFKIKVVQFISFFCLKVKYLCVWFMLFKMLVSAVFLVSCIIMMSSMYLL